MGSISSSAVFDFTDNLEQLWSSDIRNGATAQVREDVILKACINTFAMALCFRIDEVF